MAVTTSRHTISIDAKVADNGIKRAKALGYKKFSPYIEHLIKKDLEDRPAHVTVREEPDIYIHPKPSKKA